MKRGFFTSLVFGALIADMGFSQCVGSVHNRVYAIQPAGLTHQNPTTRKQGDLVRAAEEGDAATLESLLREGVDPNAGDMFDRTALQAAASKGRLDIVRKLINAGANVNGNGGVALTCAACSGHLEMMSHLLKNGADINAVERDGTTPLHRAAACNQLESVKLLLDRGAKVNAQRITGATPLMHACWYTDNPDLIRTLIQAGAKLELRDWHGEPAIVHTASEGHVKALQALIDGGAKVDEECERDQTTALHAAAASGRREALEILLRAGANPNDRADSLGSRRQPGLEKCGRRNGANAGGESRPRGRVAPAAAVRTDAFKNHEAAPKTKFWRRARRAKRTAMRASPFSMARLRPPTLSGGGRDDDQDR